MNNALEIMGAIKTLLFLLPGKSWKTSSIGFERQAHNSRAAFNQVFTLSAHVPCEFGSFFSGHQGISTFFFLLRGRRNFGAFQLVTFPPKSCEACVKTSDSKWRSRPLSRFGHALFPPPRVVSSGFSRCEQINEF